MNQTDFALAVHECLPRRPTRNSPRTGIRRSDEYGSAETIAAELFRRDFEERYPGSRALFTSQGKYLTTRVTNSPGIEFLLNMMQEHFRNWASPNNPMREGGFRKPDGMCIAARGRQVFAELLEVKPVRDETDGRVQMEDMLRRLRAGLDDVFRSQRVSARLAAEDFAFQATEWRPRPEEMVCPLLNPVGVPDLTWACFGAMRGRTHVGGVILYELHTLSFTGAEKTSKSIPPPVGDRIRTTCDARGWQILGSAPPWQEEYCSANPSHVRVLRALGLAASWAALAAALSLVLSQSNKASAAAAAAARHRTLLESNTPLTVQVGALTVLEPAIHEAIVLTDAIRRRG